MDTSKNTENGGGENQENKEDPSKRSSTEPREVVITGKTIYYRVLSTARMQLDLLSRSVVYF